MPLIDITAAGVADVFAFLPPADQHTLRSATSAMTAFFDYAAQTNTLCLYSHTEGQRWKFSLLRSADQ